ncbi:uncharacterized protein LY89DRAFT_774811 [Mollisia scopiformis]|uniref:SAP domain-containing protein n=1 Tax=Mollisia scopiformis TaxID=149040 RepID=A0A194XF00_MOLSC|nr:uncharacterized protein LY89DRAFT_774811 [Mollisia scopiformis]KUJ18714.1 hypothetical protein LY89DRAFT_774811 [Mollisia scopiformis]
MPRSKGTLTESNRGALSASKPSSNAALMEKSLPNEDAGSFPAKNHSGMKRKREERALEKSVPISGSKKKRARDTTKMKEGSRFATKDNSKLQALLSDRGLSTKGTRKDWIKRLESSTMDHASLSTNKLGQMMQQRKMQAATSYSRANRIERLKLNDEYYRDTGKPYDLLLEYANQDETLDDPNAREKLCGMQYLYEHEEVLETKCVERKMVGSGPKSAMVKFLDTGVVEYGDLYAESLQKMCKERGIHSRTKSPRRVLL